MESLDLWPYGRTRLVHILRFIQVKLEEGERLLCNRSFYATGLLEAVATKKLDKMLAVCMDERLHTAAVYLGLATDRMKTVAHLIPLLTLEGFRGVTFSTLMKSEWDYALKLVKSRPCLHDDSVFMRGLCDIFAGQTDAAPLVEHLLQNCTDEAIMNRFLLTIVRDNRYIHLFEQFLSVDRLRGFLPYFRMGCFNNASVIQGLTEQYIENVDEPLGSLYKTLLIKTVKAVLPSRFQREACEMERRTVPEVLERETPLVTAACLARPDLVKLFISLRLTSDMELRDLRQCQDPRLVRQGCSPEAVQEVRELLMRPVSQLAALCIQTISDSIALCPDRERKVSALPIPSMFRRCILFKQQLEEFEFDSKATR